MTTSIFGSVVHRVEDPRFLRGEARYTETLAPDDALRAVFVRSIIAHGAINAIDVAEAQTMPGVVAVLTGADLGLPPRPAAGNVQGFERPVLA
ncbi:MAG TPA: xanthine dehydrogenase family protein molybdopterin-binding subunit, partial [Actinomycetota bacterium]|nr:xanthine dehydrogenase family protein molybdopterin-binding subunit [Actinomycetota bacterium]